MDDQRQTYRNQGADAVLTLDAPALDEAGHPNGIRPRRVAEARARLDAGLVPISAEALAAAILLHASRERLCRA